MPVNIHWIKVTKQACYHKLLKVKNIGENEKTVFHKFWKIILLCGNRYMATIRLAPTLIENNLMPKCVRYLKENTINWCIFV